MKGAPSSMMSPKDKLLKLVPQGQLRVTGVLVLVISVGLLYWAFSSVTALGHSHEVKRLLLESGQLKLCQVELEKAKSGKGIEQCEESLRKTRASLAAALGVPSIETAVDSPSTSPRCPPCNCPSCTSSDASALPASCPPCATQDTPPTTPVTCPACPACPSAAATAAEGRTALESSAGALPSSVDGLQWKEAEAMDPDALRAEIKDLRSMAERLIAEKVRLERQLKGSTSWDAKAISSEALDSAKKLLGDCNKEVAPATVGGSGGEITAWKGYQCRATDAEMARYLNYTPRALCPQDWFFVQKLMYVKDCFALPRRRCLAVTPAAPQEPMPFPASLFDQNALIDANVRWDLHQCKSFECLNSRQVGDCRNCFNLQLEERRWKSQYRGSIKMADVIKLKEGHLRLGLDAGGGTGSFAAHMARYNVTVLTTAFNVETVPGRNKGLPYMEAIGLRGLVPLHVPHKSRLPLYDGTLDVIHSVNSIKYLPPLEFEELLYEWNRVLRVGGILWFEMFYAPVSEMPVYVQLVDMLGYKKLYWNYTPKPDAGEKEGEHVYLNCVIEKPAMPGTQVLDGPPEEDTQGIFGR